MIECIEHLHAELDIVAFTERNIFCYSQVPIVKAYGPQYVAWRITEGPRRIWLERRGIEVMQKPITPGSFLHVQWLPGQVSSVTTHLRLRIVIAKPALDRKGLA